MNYQYEPLAAEYTFQTFLKDLFNATYDSSAFEEYGSRGHTQHGIDVYDAGLKIAVQAKKKDIHRSERTILKELLSDLSDTLERIKLFPHPIEELYFATTAKKYLDVQNACMAATKEHGIRVIFLSWDDIQLKLADCPSVRNLYYPHLNEAATNSENDLEQQISRLEALISKLDIQAPKAKKQYRDIPFCDIIFPEMPQEALKKLIAIVIRMALFQTFAKTKYRKFRCLFNFSLSYTQFGDGTSAPGFEIISGEVQFLANCTRLIKRLQNEPDRFWEDFERYKEDKEVRNVRFRMELLPVEGLTCYDFEIDGQTGVYDIKVAKHEDLEYHRLDSLNAVLPFIAQSTKPAIRIIELDKIDKHSAFMKLFHHMLIEDSFRRSLLKVNVDDFDDWDFEYYPAEVD